MSPGVFNKMLMGRDKLDTEVFDMFRSKYQIFLSALICNSSSLHQSLMVMIIRCSITGGFRDINELLFRPIVAAEEIDGNNLSINLEASGISYDKVAKKMPSQIV